MLPVILPINSTAKSLVKPAVLMAQMVIESVRMVRTRQFGHLTMQPITVSPAFSRLYGQIRYAA